MVKQCVVYLSIYLPQTEFALCWCFKHKHYDKFLVWFEMKFLVSGLAIWIDTGSVELSNLYPKF